MIHIITNFNNPSNFRKCSCKRHWGDTIICRFLQGRGKMEQILLAYSFPKETVAIIIMLYKNTKVKVCLPDGNTDFFDIAAGILQGDTLASYLFIIYLDYRFWTLIDLMKENGFTLAKVRSRRYSAQTISDVNYANDTALLANTPTQGKSLVHRLEQAAGGIGLHVNADKTVHVL